MEQRTEIVVDPDANGLDAARTLIEQTAMELGFDQAVDLGDEDSRPPRCSRTRSTTATPSNGGVHLSVRQERDHMVLEVWGGASAPSALQESIGDPRNRGRGIAMMSALMDGVQLRQHNDSTRIRLAKRRRPSEAPALNA